MIEPSPQYSKSTSLSSSELAPPTWVIPSSSDSIRSSTKSYLDAQQAAQDGDTDIGATKILGSEGPERTTMLRFLRQILEAMRPSQT